MGISPLVFGLVFTLVLFSYKTAAEEVKETNKICPKNEGMNDGLRMVFLNAHNQYRSRLARGKEPDPLVGFAPKASKMLKMVYDCEIEATALKHTQKCVYKHSGTKGVGENIFAVLTPKYNRTEAAIKACRRWWEELRRGVGSDNKLNKKLLKEGMGHYTQMAWETSYRLGCAAANCPKITFVVCQYAPAGNVMGSRIYTIGEPCKSDADCPGKYTCSVAEGLCNVVK